RALRERAVQRRARADDHPRRQQRTQHVRHLVPLARLGRETMRKILIALVVAAAAFTSLAGVAAADDPNPYITVERGTNYQSASCESHATVGVLGQYGAWGWVIDGCTSLRVYCPRL